MAIKRINSKIQKYFSEELLEKIKMVYKSVLYYEVDLAEFNRFPISLGANEERILEIRADKKVRIKLMSNNTRMNLIKNFIRMAWSDKIINFGTGTNRLAVMTESLVFKIAIDKAGCVDNLHEFYMSGELYPYVTKSYETNELILVSEYVNVIKTKEEFDDRKIEIIKILRELEDMTSLMLDVGFITKNRTNWGVRVSDNKPVILDFAYIYTKLPGIQLACVNKQCREKHGIQMLRYTDNYSAMQCPACNRVYGPASFQRMISTDLRKRMYQGKLDEAYKVDKPVTYFEIDEFGSRSEVEADDSMISYEIDKSQAKEIESDYIHVCKEYERQLSYDGIVTNEIKELKEILRRSLLEVRHDMEYKDIPESEKNYDPYDDLKEEVDLVKLTGVDKELEKERQIKESKELEYKAKLKAREEYIKNLNKNNNEKGCANMNMNTLYNGKKEKELTNKELDKELDSLIKLTGADMPDSTFQGQVLTYAAERDYDEDDDFEKRLTNISDELAGELEERNPIDDDEYNIDFISAIMNKKPLPTKTCHGVVLEALDRCVELNPETKREDMNKYWDYKPSENKTIDPEIHFEGNRVDDSEEIETHASIMKDKYEKLLSSDDTQTNMAKLAEAYTEHYQEEKEALREDFENESVDMVASIFRKKNQNSNKNNKKPEVNKSETIIVENRYPRKVATAESGPAPFKYQVNNNLEKVDITVPEITHTKKLAEQLAHKVSERNSMEAFINELSKEQLIMLKDILDKKLDRVKDTINKENLELKVKDMPKEIKDKDFKLEKCDQPKDSGTISVQTKIETKKEIKTDAEKIVAPILNAEKGVVANLVIDTPSEEIEVKTEIDPKLLEGFARHFVTPVDRNKTIKIDKYNQEFPIQIAVEKNTKQGITIEFDDLGMNTTYDDVASQQYPTRLEDGTIVKGYSLENDGDQIVIRLHRDTNTLYYHEGLEAYFPIGIQESEIPNSFDKYSKVAIRCVDCYKYHKIKQIGQPVSEIENLVENQDGEEDMVIDPEKIQEAMTELKGDSYSDSVSKLVNGDVDKFIEESLDEYGDFEEASETFEKITSKNKNWK